MDKVLSLNEAIGKCFEKNTIKSSLKFPSSFFPNALTLNKLYIRTFLGKDCFSCFEESNRRWLGGKRECYLCAMFSQAPLQVHVSQADGRLLWWMYIIEILVYT